MSSVFSPRFTLHDLFDKKACTLVVRRIQSQHFSCNLFCFSEIAQPPRYQTQAVKRPQIGAVVQFGPEKDAIQTGWNKLLGNVDCHSVAVLRISQGP